MAHLLGAAYAFLGDPTVADGAGLVEFHSNESVSIDPGISSMGVSDAHTLVTDASGLYYLPPQATVTMEVYDFSLAKIAALILGGETYGTTDKGFGFGGPGLTKVAPEDVPTLIIIPSWEVEEILAAEGDIIDATSQIVIPGVKVDSINPILYNRPTAGGNANAYTITFSAVHRAKDQDDNAIPAKARFGYMGSPVVVIGADKWSYPAIS